MIICPNLSNKEVAKEFEELKNATSENAAYHIWSMNNGNSIDKAPNGEPSILFQSLLNLCNGDKTKAIQEKAKVFSTSFVNWFGDWVNSSEEASKVVDKNGEPLVVYHNSKNRRIDTYDFNLVNSNGGDLFGPGIYGSIDTSYTALFGNVKNPLFFNIRRPFHQSYDPEQDDNTEELDEFIESTKDGKIPNSFSDKYDGSIAYGSNGIEYIAWNANQIKSAVGNTGAFSTENDNILDSVYENIIQLDEARDNAVQQAVTLFVLSTDAYETKDLNDVVRNTEEEFNSTEQKSLAQRTKDMLVQSYGLQQKVDEDGNVYYEGDDIIVQFVQYLEDEFGEHDGWYDYNSSSTAVHHLAKVALNGDEVSTFNHELAHHYVRMFFDTPVIQAALTAVYKKGMTMQECEEALIDEITARVDGLFSEKDAKKTFFNKFWDKFSEMVYKVFNIQNETYKNNILNNVSRSFLLNDNQKSNPKYIAKRKMHSGRMYKDSYAKKTAQARKEARQEKWNKSPYVPIVKRADQNTIDKIVKLSILRRSDLQKDANITDKEVVRLNVFEQSVQEFATAIKEQRILEKERLKQQGMSNYQIRKNLGLNKKEFSLNIGIIDEFLTNAIQELKIVQNRFESARSLQFAKIASVILEDENSGDRTVQYVKTALTQEDFDEGVQLQDFTFEELSRAGRDTISYYRDIQNDLEKMLKDSIVQSLYSIEELLKIRDGLNIIAPILKDVEVLYRQGLTKKCEDYVLEYMDNMLNVELDDEQKRRIKLNISKWLNSEYDLAGVHKAETWIGVAEWSKSPVIRMLHQMVFDSVNEIQDKVIERKNKLYEAREKAKKSLGFKGLKYWFRSFDKNFLELDENGLPTGNLASDINKGRYYKKRSDFLDDLLYGENGIENDVRKAIKDPYYELDVDKNGNPVFPEDSRVTDAQIRYLVEYEDFLAKNGHRKYTPEYYRKRLLILCDLDENMKPKPTSSILAITAQNEIQSEIDKIIAPCIIKGKPHTELLEEAEIQQLLLLEQRKSLLSSPFTQYGEYKEEGTDEYYVYQRLKAWKEFIKTCNIVYVTDKESYSYAEEHSKNKKQFRRLNSYRQISERFWDKYISKLGGIKDDKFDQLRQERSLLISILKPRGLGLANFDIVWDEVNKTIRPEWIPFFKNLKELDSKIENRLQQLRKHNSATPAEREAVNTMTDRRPAEKRGTDLLWFDVIASGIKNKYKGQVGGKADAESEIRNMLYYTAKDKKGRTIVKKLSIFSTLFPRAKRMTDEMGEFETVERIPIRAYSTVDIENSDGRWVDKEFDPSLGSSIQPRRSIYQNHEFEKIYGKDVPQEIKDYYDLLKRTMEESYKNIPFLGEYNMMLPQKTARASTVLYRYIQKNGWKIHSALYDWLGYIWNRTFDVTENDTDINEVVYSRNKKDNTITGSAPVRYIKRLEDQSLASQDLLSTILSFYSMSMTYQNNTKLSPIFRSIHENVVSSARDRNKESRQGKVIENFVRRQLYGKTITGVPDGVLSKGWRRVVKLVKASRILSMLSLLGFSFTAGTVALLDAATSGVADVATRRSYGFSDLFNTIGQMIVQTPAVLLNAGAIKKLTILGYGKLPQLLEEFHLGGSVLQDIEHSDVNRLRRLTDYTSIAMLPFSLGEHFINSMTLLLNLNSYRLYDGKEFLSRSEFKKRAMSEGLSRAKADAMYISAPKLYNAYTTDKKGIHFANNEGGNVLSNMSEEDYRKFKNRLVAKGVSKAASYNALIPETERSEAQTNIVFNWVTMVRNFLLLAFWERFSKLNDFYDPDAFDSDETKTEEMFTEGEKKRMRAAQAEYSGGLNFMTVEVATGRTRAFARLLFTRDNEANSFLSKCIKNIGTLVKYAYALINGYRNPEFNKYEYRKEHHLSEADLHGFNLACVELITIGVLTGISALFHNKFVDDYNDEYWFLFVDFILLRLPLERISLWHVNTVMEIITSITAGKTAFDRTAESNMFKQMLKDYQQHGLLWDDYETVNTEGFKGEKILFRETLKFFSFTGIYNLHRTTKARPIEYAKQFYKKLPGSSANLWNDEKTKSNKSDKSNNSRFASY